MGSDASARAISTRRRSPPDRATAGASLQMRDGELLQQFVQARLPVRGIAVDDLQRHADILADTEAAEDRRFLRQIADAQPCPPVHRHRRDVGAVQQDLALIRFDQAADDIEAGGLSRAVGSQQTHDFAALKFSETSRSTGRLRNCLPMPWTTRPPADSAALAKPLPF